MCIRGLIQRVAGAKDRVVGSNQWGLGVNHFSVGFRIRTPWLRAKIPPGGLETRPPFAGVLASRIPGRRVTENAGNGD